jgi:glycosyltransferase involved in cell wall biosynthesis
MGMHIVIINQYCGSLEHGMEYRHYYLAKEMIKMGDEVTIISGSYSHLHKKQPVTNGRFTFEEIDGIKYCWVKIPSYKKSISLGRFFNMVVFACRIRNISKVIKPPDAITVSSPSLFPIVTGKKWATKCNAKLFFEIRDIWPLTLQEIGGLKKYHPLVKVLSFFERYGYKNADKVVSLLPNAYLHFKKFYLPESNFVYIPNGIEEVAQDSYLPLPESHQTLIAQLKSEGKFIIAYTGSHGVANSLDVPIKAFSQMKQENIALVLVGKGQEKENLKKLAKELNCKNVHFLNPVDKLCIPNLLSQFDGLYIGLQKHPLFRMGISPNKMFDYMWAAKPIIQAIEAGNNPVEEAQCGFYAEPENIEEIKNAILKLVNLSEKERVKMGLNGKEFVIKNHSYKNLALKYKQIIDDA